MEAYGTIYFKNENNDITLVDMVKDLAISTFGLGIEGEETSNGYSTVEVIGGSRTEDGVEEIVKVLNDKNISLVKAYVIGDEEPWCRLYSINDSGVATVQCSDGIYEYLSECEEDEINEVEELRIAHETKPRDYFEPKFNAWNEGLESVDTKAIKGLIEIIIECSEDLVS